MPLPDPNKSIDLNNLFSLLFNLLHQCFKCYLSLGQNLWFNPLICSACELIKDIDFFWLIWFLFQECDFNFVVAYKTFLFELEYLLF